MIEIEYSKLFLKDLKKLIGAVNLQKIKKFCFEEIESYNSVLDIPDLKKIEGYQYYFRKRMGNYRIGIKYKNGKLIFMRVLNRKEIYRKFP